MRRGEGLCRSPSPCQGEGRDEGKNVRALGVFRWHYRHAGARFFAPRLKPGAQNDNVRRRLVVAVLLLPLGEKVGMRGSRLAVAVLLLPLREKVGMRVKTFGCCVMPCRFQPR